MPGQEHHYLLNSFQKLPYCCSQALVASGNLMPYPRTLGSPPQCRTVPAHTNSRETLVPLVLLLTENHRADQHLSEAPSCSRTHIGQEHCDRCPRSKSSTTRLVITLITVLIQTFLWSILNLQNATSTEAHG